MWVAPSWPRRAAWPCGSVGWYACIHLDSFDRLPVPPAESPDGDETTCPRFNRAKWFSMKRVTAWLKTHRVIVFDYLIAKKPACTPMVDWWIVLFCLESVATGVSWVVTRLQGLCTCLPSRMLRWRSPAPISGKCALWRAHCQPRRLKQQTQP